jgi:hypothetical protein
MSIYGRQEMTVIHHIINQAQSEIHQKSGIEVMLMPRFSNTLIEEDIKQTFEDMCACWGVNLRWVSDKSRANDRPIMRKLLWMVGKRKHPNASYCFLAHLTGTNDHAGVIKGIRSGYNWLHVQDEKFLKYYEPVKDYFDPGVEIPGYTKNNPKILVS